MNQHDGRPFAAIFVMERCAPHLSRLHSASVIVGVQDDYPEPA